MPIPIDALVHLKRLGEPVASPDGRSVALAISEVDLDNDGYRSRIHLWRQGTGQLEPFTAGPADRSPAWSPDGRHLAFLGVRGDDAEAEVYVLAVDGGEAVRRTTGLRGAAGLAWSADGESLAVIAWRDQPEPETESLWRAVAEDGDRATGAERTASLILTSRLRYRFDGVGYARDRRRHLLVVPATGGETRWLTGGPFDVESFVWHPDGRTLTLVTSRRPEAEARGRSAAYEVDRQGGEPRLLADPGGSVSALAWSPDGARLAFIGTDDSAGPASSPRLWLLNGRGDGPHRLLPSLDRPVGAGLFSHTAPLGTDCPVAWDASGQRLYVQVHDGGDVRLCAVDIARPDDRIELLPSGWHGSVGAFAVGPRRLWLVAEDESRPSELFELELADPPLPPVRRSDLHTSLAEAWGTHPGQAFRYPGGGGLEIEAFVVRPADMREGERRPLLLLVHGGPHGAFGRVYDPDVQHHASQGRVVLMVNPRGSSGYGQDFAALCVGDWGGGDYADIMAAVDHAIGQGWVDPARMAVNGISYGGYMTSWILTHTDRFACAIPEMLISNLVSMFGQSDISYYMMEFEGPGTPWAGAQHLWQHSPLAHVLGASTPTLLIQGEADYRCPIGQAEELFVSLRRLGVEAVLARLEGASHIVSHIGPPSQRLVRLRLIEAWLADHGVRRLDAPDATPVVRGAPPA